MKKLLSLVLALCLVLGVVPVSLSDDAPEENVASEPAPVVAEAAEEPAPAPAPAPAEEKPAEKKEEKKEEPAQAAEEPAQEPAQEPAEEVKEETPVAPEEEKPAGEPEEEKPAGEPEEEKPAGEPEEEPEGEEELKAPEGSKGPEADIEADPSEIETNDVPPAKVKKVEFKNPTSTEVTLEWPAVTTDRDGKAHNADGYEVRWSATTTDYTKVEAANIKTTTSTNYTVTGLTCGQDYTYWVSAYYEVGGNPTDWSKPLDKTYHTAPAAPTGFAFALAPDSAVSMVFTWTREAEATGYNIYSVIGGKESDDPIATLAKNPANPTKTVKNIELADELTYRIYSYKTVSGVQVQSADYDEATMEYVVPAPTNLQAVSYGKDSIRLTWNAMEGATKYVLERYDGSEYATLAELTSTTYTDSGLIFGMEYSYTVTAWVGEREGLESIGATAQVSGVAPGNLKVDNATDGNYNTITWNKADNANGYLLQWSDDYDSANPGTETWHDVEINALVYKHEGLTFGTEYSYRVSGYVNVSGAKVYTPWSKIVTVRAKPQQPVWSLMENQDYKTQYMEWDPIPTVSDYEVDYSTSSDFSKDKVTTAVSGVENFTHTKCANGTKYYYRVRALVTVGSTEVPGPYSATKSLTCAPAKPAPVSAIYNPGVNQVKVEWSLTDGATDYRVFYKENDAGWTTATTVKATSEATQSYTIKNLNVGSQYMFAVSSVRTADGKTAVGQKETDGPIDLSVTDFDPTNLAYTVVNRKKVTVTWKAPKGVTLFAVTGDCAEDAEFKDTFGEKEVSTNSITIGSLKPGYNYTFTVRSKVVVDDVAEYGNPVDLVDVIPTSLPPANVKVSADTVHYGAKLSWEKSSGASGYIIYWSTSPDDPDLSHWYLVTQITDPDVLAYTDNDPMYDNTTVGNPYYYRVYSYIDHGGEQLSPTPASVKYTVKAPKPTLKLTATGKTSIEINVTNDADIAPDWYYIYRSTSASSGFTLIADNAGSTWTDTTVKFGTTYYYYAEAVCDKGGTDVRSKASAKVSGQGKLPAVQNLVVKKVHGGSIEVGWDALGGATGYEVYYKPDGGSWKLFGSVGKTTYKKNVTGLNPKTKYYFRVAGTAKAGSKTITGNYSNTVDETTAMEAVQNLKVSPKDCTSVTLTWDKTTDATSYEVRVEDPVVNPGVWTKKATVSTNSATLTGLGKNKRYNFKVRAIINRNSIQDKGAYSTDFNGYTAPAKVTGIKASSIKTSKLTLSWDKSTGADGYRIQYYAPGGTWTDNEEYVEGATSKSISGLSSGTLYTFRVTPYWSEGGSEYYGKNSSKYTVTTK